MRLFAITAPILNSTTIITPSSESSTLAEGSAHPLKFPECRASVTTTVILNSTALETLLWIRIQKLFLIMKMDPHLRFPSGIAEMGASHIFSSKWRFIFYMNRIKNDILFILIVLLFVCFLNLFTWWIFVICLIHLPTFKPTHENLRARRLPRPLLFVKGVGLLASECCLCI